MIEAALTVFIVTLVLFIAWSGILMMFSWWRNRPIVEFSGWVEAKPESTRITWDCPHCLTVHTVAGETTKKARECLQRWTCP